jgi:hypothetical protein
MTDEAMMMMMLGNEQEGILLVLLNHESYCKGYHSSKYLQGLLVIMI